MPELKDEKELEDYLFNLYMNDGSGFTTLRQVPLSIYGVADIIRFRESAPREDFKLLAVEVIELKKGKIGFTELAQLLRYKTALQRYFDANNEFGYNAIELTAEIIGSGIENGGDFVFLLNEILVSGYINITTYKITLDKGIEFDAVQSGWRQSKEDLNDIKLPVPALKKKNLIAPQNATIVKFSG